MPDFIRHIFILTRNSIKEIAICLLLITLTFATLFWPDNRPSVVFLCEPSGSSLNNSQQDLYLCSINFSHSQWPQKYEEFNCYMKVGDKIFHLLNDTLQFQHKDFTFNLSREIVNSIAPGKHKCAIMICPNTKGSEKPTLLYSNTLYLEF
ncbi:MAG: hypothetical protein JW745_08085 [Sedimentisphaerales bacterium]|nr:hypothetical protein [Sedimentisphaerales bacterium]MBN2843996.1 hypothetical protein [Sedimentisphaerales bacterium]